jgi:hypothetical protein
LAVSVSVLAVFFIVKLSPGEAYGGLRINVSGTRARVRCGFGDAEVALPEGGHADFKHAFPRSACDLGAAAAD